MGIGMVFVFSTVGAENPSTGSGQVFRPCNRSNDMNDSMHMIRHDDERVQFHIWKMFRYFIPAFFRNYSSVIQLHRAADNIAKQMFAVVNAKGDEIRAVAGVIVSTQSGGSSMMFPGIEFHPRKYGMEKFP